MDRIFKHDQEPRCVAPMDDTDDPRLCGLAATETREADGLECTICAKHAAELDSERGPCFASHIPMTNSTDSVTVYVVTPVRLGSFITIVTADRARADKYATAKRATGLSARVTQEECPASDWAAESCK